MPVGKSEKIKVCFVHYCAIHKTVSVLSSNNAKRINLKRCYFNF